MKTRKVRKYTLSNRCTWQHRLVLVCLLGIFIAPVVSPAIHSACEHSAHPLEHSSVCKWVKDGKLCLAFKPTIPGWLFDRDDKLTFAFLGSVSVTYHNPGRLNICATHGVSARSVILHLPDQGQIEFTEGIITEPYALMVRSGRITEIDVHLRADTRFHW